MNDAAVGGYRPYPAYKNSGVEWLGEVPGHWEIKRAKFMFRRMQRPVRPEDDVITAFRDGTVTLRRNRRTEGFTFSDKEIGYQGIRTGDLVIHAMDGFAGAIGVSDSDGKSTPVYSVLRPQTDGQIEIRYFAYLIRFMALSGFVTALARGIRERSTEFRYAEVRELWLPLQPLPEQHTIAAFLEHKTAEIDTLIAAKERLIALLREKRAALITSAVTKGLDPDVAMKDSGVEWLGEVPEHWEGTSLKRWVATKITDGPHETPEFLDEGVPFVSAEAVTNGRIDFNKKRGYISEELHRIYSRKCKPIRDDILLCKSGATTGKFAIVEVDFEFSVWSPLALIRPIHTLILPRFLSLVLEADYIQNQIRQTWSAGTQPNISMGDLELLYIVVPPIEEQKAILEQLKTAMPEFDMLFSKVQGAIDRLKEYRTALISAAVTGKIDVRNL